MLWLLGSENKEHYLKNKIHHNIIYVFNKGFLFAQQNYSIAKHNILIEINKCVKEIHFSWDIKKICPITASAVLRLVSLPWLLSNK